MADKRMFSSTIVESDAFLDMPISTQLLYFHLGMYADDDGFVNSPKRIQRLVGCGDDDFKVLCSKGFLILFDSGVVVVKHWLINNYIRPDRYKPSPYIEELNCLSIKANKSYTLTGIPDGYQEVTKKLPLSDIDKNRQEQNRLEKNREDKTTTASSILDLLSDEEQTKLGMIVKDPHDYISLIDEIDMQDLSGIKKPYSYVIQVAKNKGYV